MKLENMGQIKRLLEELKSSKNTMRILQKNGFPYERIEKRISEIEEELKKLL